MTENTLASHAALIREWATNKELHKADPMKQTVKLVEEVGELAKGIIKKDEALTKDSIGDAFVVLTILAMQTGTSIEECVQLAYDEIKDRKGVTKDGVFIKASDLK